jgi:hypothetical protein
MDGWMLDNNDIRLLIMTETDKGKLLFGVITNLRITVSA